MSPGWMILSLGLIAMAQDFEPPRLESAAQVRFPPMPVVGGGEAWLQVELSESGDVAEITTLRDTPPYTEALRSSVSQWRFTPARTAEGPTSAQVFVAALFRPPTTYSGATLGEQPRDVGSPAAEIPYPLSTATPVYPAATVGEGLVFVEITIEASGKVSEVRVIHSAASFDAAALDAARQWSFRPARHEATPVPSHAYVVFGFREPVVPPPR